MKPLVRLCVVGGIALSAFGSAVAARATTPNEVAARVGLDQHPGALLPLKAAFRDERGQRTSLGTLLAAKPAIVALVYYDCPNLCTVTLSSLLRGLAAVDLTAGRDFAVIAISIDPGETPALATAKRASYLARYGRCRGSQDGCGPGWHFLTGAQPAIDAVTRAVGFRYFWDPDQAQFAHPLGVVVVTPNGRIARYFTGVQYPSADLRAALTQASADQIDSFADRFWLLCYHYQATLGRYGAWALGAVRVVGVGAALLLAAYVFRSARRSS